MTEATRRLVEAAKVALGRMAHHFECSSILPTEDWAERGSWSFDNCECEIRCLAEAIAAVEAEPDPMEKVELEREYWHQVAQRLGLVAFDGSKVLTAVHDLESKWMDVANKNALEREHFADLLEKVRRYCEEELELARKEGDAAEVPFGWVCRAQAFRDVLRVMEEPAIKLSAEQWKEIMEMDPYDQ